VRQLVHPRGVRRIEFLAVAIGVLLTVGAPTSLASTSGPSRRPEWLQLSGPQPVHQNRATDVAFSPRRGSVFVAGPTISGTRPDRTIGATIVSYSTVTGEERWATTETVSRSAGTARVAVTPDSTRVLMAFEGDRSIVTAAYSTVTGRRLWRSAVSGTEGAIGVPGDIAISSDGTRAFVTGDVDEDFTTVAYDVATGSELWRTVEPGGRGWDVAVAPSAGRVFVAGSRNHGGGNTFAYNAATGVPLWATTVTTDFDTSDELALSPDGSRLYVASGPTALRASDGAVIWRGKNTFVGTAALGPNGHRFFVTSAPIAHEVTVVAWKTTSGTARWTRTFSPEPLHAVGIAASERRVFVLAREGHRVFDASFFTASLRSDSGKIRWVSRLHRPAGATAAVPAAVALAPGAARVVDTGTLYSDDGKQFVTASYRA
jgi:outer membrane protein assembly factor BamB